MNSRLQVIAYFAACCCHAVENHSMSNFCSLETSMNSDKNLYSINSTWEKGLLWTIAISIYGVCQKWEMIKKNELSSIVFTFKKIIDVAEVSLAYELWSPS